jgi:hypothetical protein
MFCFRTQKGHVKPEDGQVKREQGPHGARQGWSVRPVAKAEPVAHPVEGGMHCTSGEE